MLVDGKIQSRWDIPGGGIDHGEDVFQTLKREILEETGLKVLSIEPRPKYFFVGESTCRNIPLALVCYEVAVEDFDYTPTDECREMQFFSLDEALEVDIYPAIRTSLEEAKRVFGIF
jgi:8-oxo-dGTP pyrophosphatase MutT (NUDIX family)